VNSSGTHRFAYVTAGILVAVTDGVATMYERVGGRPFFVALVDRFYDAVADDPVLRTLYPEDLGPSRAHLAGFLVQYWGGPDDYSIERGHPRLRKRHVPFAIGRRERDAWFRLMRDAVESGGLSPGDEAEMIGYFDSAATFLINRSDEPPGG
jgi:hemoglobin